MMLMTMMVHGVTRCAAREGATGLEDRLFSAGLILDFILLPSLPGIPLPLNDSRCVFSLFPVCD